MWLFEIILVILIPRVLCKMHPHNIIKETYPISRQYTPKHLNDNDDGWLIRIVKSDGSFVCGGTYIAPLIVVTSANCIHQYLDELTSLVAQTGRNQDNEDDFAYVKSSHIPPEFNEGEPHMDVAVLRLETPIKGRSTEFIKLCTTHITTKMKLTSYGWGYGNPVKLRSTLSDPIKTIAPIIDIKLCQKQWSKRGKTIKSKSNLCVQFEALGPAQCLYDPGCPLIYNDQFCGIVSESISCNDTKLPAIYTDVNKVRDFILLTEANIRFRIYENLKISRRNG